LKNPNPFVRERVAYALGNISDPRAAKALMKAFRQRELDVVAGADSFFLQRIGPPAFGELADAFVQFGDERMADDMLNAADPKLQQAGEQWGRSHGFMVFGTSSGGKQLGVP
jgi:HEAT repeat protein